LKDETKPLSVTKRPERKDSPEWIDIEARLMALVKDQKPGRLKVLQEIFRSAVKLAQESPGTLNLKITSTVLKELRYSFKIFASFRHSPKITMFGSARVPPETPLYAFAKKFAAESVARKYMIITGGGPGIMAAGNEGASLDSGFGNIRLPFEQSANPFIDQKRKLLHYKYFFIRKLFLVKEAAAFVFFPGGLGTLDEAFEVLTLLQTGKTNLIPVVLLEPKGFGFWTKMMKFLDEVALKQGFISEQDASLFRVYHTPKEALDHFDKFYSTYHSMRYVKEGIIIRLKRDLSDAAVKKLNLDFADFFHLGKIKKTGPIPEELNEPELSDLPRLFFPFDKRDFGTLRRLVDAINDLGV
jgi:uncharacterized protein (TIGR00730 family)